MKRILIIVLLAPLAMMSCGFFGSDELSTYEEEVVAEQSAAAVSTEEGGMMYSVELVADEDFYAEVNAQAGVGYNPSTGKISFTLDAEFEKVDGSVGIDVTVLLKDASGNPQTSFTASTYSAEIELSMENSVSSQLLETSSSKTASLKVTGLNTNTVKVSGDWDSTRQVDSSTGYALEVSLDMDQSYSFSNISLTRASSSDPYYITGGTASAEVTGSMNRIDFDRTVEWVFGDSYTASMTINGDEYTVNIETGIILN